MPQKQLIYQKVSNFSNAINCLVQLPDSVLLAMLITHTHTHTHMILLPSNNVRVRWILYVSASQTVFTAPRCATSVVKGVCEPVTGLNFKW